MKKGVEVVKWGIGEYTDGVIIKKEQFCKKCGEELEGKQISFCSTTCSKRYLKSQYKKRNKEKINAYNRKYRSRIILGHPCTNKTIKQHIEKYPVCEKCGTDIGIQVCHVKPRDLSKRHKDNLISLCKIHHSEFDKALLSFWRG